MDARGIATWPIEALDQSVLDRVAAARENNRNCRRCRLRRPCRLGPAGRDDHVYLAANQISRQCRQPIVLALCPTVFDRQIFAFDVAGFAQALAERGQITPVALRVR